VSPLTSYQSVTFRIKVQQALTHSNQLSVFIHVQAQTLIQSLFSLISNSAPLSEKTKRKFILQKHAILIYIYIYIKLRQAKIQSN
jgi:hypothetical protein